MILFDICVQKSKQLTNLAVTRLKIKKIEETVKNTDKVHNFKLNNRTVLSNKKKKNGTEIF